VGEILWFEMVGYLPIFLTRLKTQVGLGLVVGAVSSLFLWGNLRLADGLKWQSPPFSSPQSPRFGLGFLLPLVVTLSVFVLGLFGHYCEIFGSLWHLQNYPSLINIPPAVPPTLILFLAQFNIVFPLLGLGVLVGGILRFPRMVLRGIAIALTLLFIFIVSQHWSTVLQFFNATDFNKVDPLFGKDVKFYIFTLPFLQLLELWLGGLLLFALTAVAIVYLTAAESISDGKFVGFSCPQLRHLYILFGAVFGFLAGYHWLNRYQLVYSTQGVIYGASYTETRVSLPLQTFLSFLCLAFAFFSFLLAIKKRHQSFLRKQPQKNNYVWVCLIIYLICFGLGKLTEIAIQHFYAEPNELAKELPYITRTIAQTRAAFGLDEIEVKTFNPQDQLTWKDIQANSLTINNIRLWDTQPLLQTNRQLQQIRLYYKFLDADIDRYPISSSISSLSQRDKQQVLIAPRELDYNAVPEEAKTWVNEHLVYTHGYGFTLSPVNRVDTGGLPYYFVKDIGTETEVGGLRVSDDSIQKSILIGKPRIYYGELTNNYILTDTKTQELDFPKGDDNAYNVYDGTGGIGVGSFWRKAIFALYLEDWRLLFTENTTPNTRLLFRRNINQRVQAIAPFLAYDGNPYLVVADAGDVNQAGAENYLHWLMEGYTQSAYYPYADPGERTFNYIRNSVKIVVDSYNGDVQFYVADKKDPMIKTWQKIFPDLFKPLEEMPNNLQYHLRYPQDFFSVQSERLLSYHMKDPKVFYNREDQWQIPQEIYGNKSLAVQPYYLIMKLPTGVSEEFMLLHPYTPTSRNNLIALLFAASDGVAYGKMTLYQLPKQKQIYGPEQIEALINQDPDISQQIALWNREGSRTIQGNLLVIPIDESTIYVEPLYLEAEKTSLPTLARVVVVYQDKIVMEKTLQEAMEKIFLQ